MSTIIPITPNPLAPALVEAARLVAIANRQRLLNAEADRRVINAAVAKALKG